MTNTAAGTDTVHSEQIPVWLSTELATVPAYDAFAGVDALVAGVHAIAREYPDCAALHRVGTSRQGEPLWCLTISEDVQRPSALVVGLPHPNEPIGGLTALHLARRLCADPALRARLAHTWHIVVCADPDGLRLNEGWLAGPFTRAHYARHFYRPEGDEQVEWTFPVAVGEVYHDRPIPETEALMRLIDQHRPALLAALHNGELGGAFYYLSRAEPRLHGVLKAVPQSIGIPLHGGEPESPIAVPLDQAIFLSPDAESFHERLTAAGIPWPPHGGSTTMYSARYGTFTVLSELPYWSDPAADDHTPSGISYAASLTRLGEGVVELGEVLTRAVDDVEGHLLAPSSPLWTAGSAFARVQEPSGRSILARAGRPESDREATVAEVRSLGNSLHAHRLRFAGMVNRVLQGEIAMGNVREPVRVHAAAIAARYETWLDEDAAAIQLEPIPIGKLVTVQYAAVIGAAAHLAGTL
ncbi:M14 family zinc carboxypeptidase [Amycolatopsis ultiminotia]|uniref:M14 family zinc carboxypeptidase n=1 Tax=Amycolatopsis ultiminotia TaxID=543629 RepID=A0ABP6YPF6_9PSEU